jgi:hypothetical protein
MDAWAVLVTGKRVDSEVRRADQPVLQRGRCLDRQQFRHQGLVEPTATLGEPCREYERLLGSIHLDRCDPTGRHHGQVGPQPAADRLVRTGQLLLQ